MNSQIYRKVTSLTLMTIMVAGGLTFAIPGVIPAQAEAISSNPHLFVSAEGQNSDNEISPHNIIEVVIDDPNIRETDDATGRPTVTINGADLSMVQGTDGAWYAYFGDRASLADNGVQDIGYGEYHTTRAAADKINVAPDKPAVDLSGTVGAMLYDTNNNYHPLIREAKTPNDYNSDVAYWPFIQLYDIAADSNLKIVYDRAGGDETVTLLFDDPSEGHSLDREKYPVDAQVLITIDDYTLNIDPTDEDTWAFDTTNGIAYYNLFDEDGQMTTSEDNPKANYASPQDVDIDETLTIKRNAQGGQPLINCQVTQDFGSVDNNELLVNDTGLCYDSTMESDHILAKDTNSLIVNFVENGSNESTFVNWAEDNKANLIVDGDAARGNSFEVQYDSPGYISGLVGHFYADFTLDTEAVGGVWNSGERLAVTLTDTDANTNPLEEQELEVNNVETKLVPTIQIGNPFTLRTGDSSLDVKWTPIGIVADPITEPDPPITEPDPPITEPDPPITEPDPPITEPDPPITEPDPPITEPDPPITEPDPPITEPDPPITEPDPPITEPDPPITEPDPPITEPDPPITEPDPPITEPDPPITEPDPPITEPDPPITEPDPPITEPDPPITEPDTDPPNAPLITNEIEKVTNGMETITGTADEVSTIKIYSGVDDSVLATITDAGMEWSVDISFKYDGPQSITATATDVANNESVHSAPLQIAVVGSPINATSILTPDGVEEITTTPVTVNGVAHPSSLVTLTYDDDGLTESTTVTANDQGAWATTLDITNGTYILTAVSDENPIIFGHVDITVAIPSLDIPETDSYINITDMLYNYTQATPHISGNSNNVGDSLNIEIIDQSTGERLYFIHNVPIDDDGNWRYAGDIFPNNVGSGVEVVSIKAISMIESETFTDVISFTIDKDIGSIPNYTDNVEPPADPTNLVFRSDISGTLKTLALQIIGSSTLSTASTMTGTLYNTTDGQTNYYSVRAPTTVSNTGNYTLDFDGVTSNADNYVLTLNGTDSHTREEISNTFEIIVSTGIITSVTPATGTDLYNTQSQIHNIVQQNYATIHKAFADGTSVVPIHNIATEDYSYSFDKSAVDAYSDRLIISSADDTVYITDTAVIKIDLDATADDLMDSIHEPGKAGFDGTNIFNYDISGIVKNNENFVITDIKLVDGGSSSSGKTVTLASDSDSGSIDLANVNNHSDIFEMTGSLYLEIHLDTSKVRSNTYTFDHDMPIVADFFSFGLVDLEGDRINNAIYRLQLEEDGKNSSDFVGDVEYIMLNQLNILEPDTYADLRTISDQIQIIVHEDFTDEDSVRINYLDLGADGVSTQIAIQQEAPTHSGVVLLNSGAYKVADTVTITLKDADLNVDTDVVDIYTIVGNDILATHNTVGSSDDTIGMLTFANGNPFARLLDVTFNDELWTNCGNDAGFSGTGLTMIETAKDSGVFTGDFQIPEMYCAGGDTSKTVTGVDIEVNYLDFRDASGETIEVGASASVGSHTGSVSLDRTVYPVPIGAGAFKMANGESLEARDLSAHIRINDPDFDLSAIGEDTIPSTGDTTPLTDYLSVKILRGSNSVYVAITDSKIYEVAPDTGIFELDLTISSTMGPDNQIRQGDILQVRYNDPTDASGNQNTVTDSATFNLRNAILQSDKPAYIIGSNMILTLIEPDFDLDNDAAETYPLNLIEWDSDAATVPMGSDLAFDPEPSDLRETGDSTGIFQVIVEIPSELEGDRLERGEEIELEYVDWSPSGADTVGDEDEDVNLTVYTSNFGATVELDQKVYTWTDKVYITIVAPDHNFDSYAVDEIGDTPFDPIKIATRGHDIDEYTLVETDTSTGIFTGEIILTGFKHDADGNTATGDDRGYDTHPRTSGTGPTNGYIQADDDDGITVSFEFSEDDTVVTSSLIRWNVGDIQWLEASYPASGTGIVRIIDPDMNWNPESVNNFDVDVWSNSDAGGIDLTVTETNEATGIFEGTVVFTTTDPSSGHRLRVAEGDLITASYEDNTLPDPYTTADELDVTATSLIGTIVPPLERAAASNLRVVDAFGSSINAVSIDQQIQITADLANGQDRGQLFAYLVQIQDGSGITVSLAWITGTLESGQALNPALSWIPTKAGVYEATAFVWESVDNPTALSPSISTLITVI